MTDKTCSNESQVTIKDSSGYKCLDGIKFPLTVAAKVYQSEFACIGAAFICSLSLLGIGGNDKVIRKVGTFSLPLTKVDVVECEL